MDFGPWREIFKIYARSIIKEKKMVDLNHTFNIPYEICELQQSKDLQTDRLTECRTIASHDDSENYDIL